MPSTINWDLRLGTLSEIVRKQRLKFCPPPESCTSTLRDWLQRRLARAAARSGHPGERLVDMHCHHVALKGHGGDELHVVKLVGAFKRKLHTLSSSQPASSAVTRLVSPSSTSRAWTSRPQRAK